jgi:hypothetical protein
MGGYSSGRRNQDGKRLTVSFNSLDIRFLQRKGLLAAGSSTDLSLSGGNRTVSLVKVTSEYSRVILRYSRRLENGNLKFENYPVSIEWTPCNYGGMRAWFRCPTLGCNRRVAILYGGEHFACRHCYQLAYPCQRDSSDDGTFRQVRKMRNRLGWGRSIISGCGERPKGMHWSTYIRLFEELIHLQTQLISASAKRIGLKI